MCAIQRDLTTILLVEDRETIRRTFAWVLRRAGYRVLEAEDGLAAIKTVREHAGPINLLITDVQMPRMDGHELARTLKAPIPTLAIIIVSSDREVDFPTDTVAYDAVLVKPVDAERLLEVVAKVLDPARKQLP